MAQSVTIDTTNFNLGLKGLIMQAKLNSRLVVEKESGELIKTLVKISPPREPSKTKASISKKINASFNQLREMETRFEQSDIKPSSTGIKWYAANSEFLFGVAADADMRKSSESDLLQVYYRSKIIQLHRRIVLPFKNRKTSQRVALLGKILTTTKQVNIIIKRIQGHVGRLKCGWLVAVRDGAIRLSGSDFIPPQWVTRHLKGARGWFINELGRPQTPTFTIANTSKGVSAGVSKYFVQQALNIRAKAMAANLAHFLSGKKPLSAYAGGIQFKIKSA